MKLKYVFFFTVFVQIHSCFSMDKEPVIFSTQTYKESSLGKMRYLVSTGSLLYGAYKIYYLIKNKDFSQANLILPCGALVTSLLCLSKHDLLSLIPFYRIKADYEREDVESLIAMQQAFDNKFTERPKLTEEDRKNRTFHITAIEERFFYTCPSPMWQTVYNNNKSYKMVELDALEYVKKRADKEKARRLYPIYERYKLLQPFYLRLLHWMKNKPQDELQKEIDRHQRMRKQEIPITRHHLICDLLPYLVDQEDVEYNLKLRRLPTLKQTEEEEPENFKDSNLYQVIVLAGRIFNNRQYQYIEDGSIRVPPATDTKCIADFFGIEENKVSKQEEISYE
jgi:hypothetical protein